MSVLKVTYASSHTSGLYVVITTNKGHGYSTWVRDNWKALSHTYCNVNYYVTKTISPPLPFCFPGITLVG